MSTFDLDGVSVYLKQAAAKMKRQSPELVRRCGVAVLNVAGRSTPPNRGGMGKGRKQTGYGQKNVKSLQVRIAAEITGREELKPTVLPTAVPLGDGSGLAWEGPEVSWGGYGFRVPRPEKGKKSFPRVQYVDPMDVLRRRRFRRAGDVVRAWSAVPADGIRWVKRAALLNAVKHYQARAGKLITGWLPAAEALQASNARRDFRVSKFSRQGSARLDARDFWVELRMSADWGGLIVARRMGPWFLNYVEDASWGVIENTTEKFFKYIFK